MENESNNDLNVEEDDDEEEANGENAKEVPEQEDLDNNTGSEKSTIQLSEERTSLSSVYGPTIGFWQSLSLLLNASLMVFAQVGLSAVIVSNHQRIPETSNSASAPPLSPSTNSSSIYNLTGYCTIDDFIVWEDGGGAINKTKESNYCARQYGGTGCLLDVPCTTDCFHTQFGYTVPCAACFAAIPSCSLTAGCAYICQQNGESAECGNCTIGCNGEFEVCSGLSLDVASNQTSNTTEAPTRSPLNDTNGGGAVVGSLESNAEICARQQQGVDPATVEEYFVVYKLKFFVAVKTAWNSNARLLAVIVMMFSGIWPYVKKIILMVAWYLPMPPSKRSQVLRWLRRLGKYTLVDIYVSVLIMIGVTLQISVADGVPVIIKGEPRAAIIAFLVATLWEFVHIEWMTELHTKNLSHAHDETNDEKVVLSALRFRTESGHAAAKCRSPVTLRLSLWLLLVSAIGLFLAGSLVEVMRFTSVLAGESEGCVRSYNLYKLGTVLVSDFFLQDNRDAGVWTLYMTYIMLVAVLPLFVHAVHVVFVLNGKVEKLYRIADICWTFASVEVLMLAVFVVQYKFDALIGALAGNDGSQFFGMKAELGLGFYVLIAYSVLGGLTHYFFNVAVSEFYRIDPSLKVDSVWTKTFGCLLEGESKAADREQ